MIKFIKAGYAGRNSLSGITAEAALSLNVMNIAFGHVADSRIVFDCGCAEDIDRIKTLNPEIKILLSVGGWGSGGFSPMASAPETRHKFAGSAGKILTECGLDGIDLDWEYPCIDTAGIEASPDDKFNFTLLLAALREELDTKKINSGNRPMMTIAAGAGDYYIKNTQIDLIAPMVDYISVMTYDMRGSWSYTTGHHTNLFKPQNSETDPESAEHSVGLFTSAGVPRKKIVIGSAFYSRKWENVKNENNGYLQQAKEQAVTDLIIPICIRIILIKTDSSVIGTISPKHRIYLTAIHLSLMMTSSRLRKNVIISETTDYSASCIGSMPAIRPGSFLE